MRARDFITLHYRLLLGTIVASSLADEYLDPPHSCETGSGPGALLFLNLQLNRISKFVRNLVFRSLSLISELGRRVLTSFVF